MFYFVERRRGITYTSSGLKSSNLSSGWSIGVSISIRRRREGESVTTFKIKLTPRPKPNQIKARVNNPRSARQPTVKSTTRSEGHIKSHHNPQHPSKPLQKSKKNTHQRQSSAWPYPDSRLSPQSSRTSHRVRRSFGRPSRRIRSRLWRGGCGGWLCLEKGVGVSLLV